MRRPSGRCTINTVAKVQVAGWTKDAAGGRHATFAAPSAPIACSVQPSTAVDVAPHLREEGVTYLTVIAHDDPQLALRDQLLWGTRVLTVTGVIDASGRGRSFRVLCEERV